MCERFQVRPDFPDPMAPRSTRLHSAGLLSAELPAFTFPNIEDMIISSDNLLQILTSDNHPCSYSIIIKCIKTNLHTDRVWWKKSMFDSFFVFPHRQTLEKCPHRAKRVDNVTLYSRSCAVVTVWFNCSRERVKKTAPCATDALTLSILGKRFQTKACKTCNETST